jgi:predicted DCC family thiol-disulfide oxidoreductase YuxK
MELSVFDQAHGVTIETSADPGAEGSPGSATPAPTPVWLTVLYDAGCPLCRWVRTWLERQDLLVPLVFVPLRSTQAWQAFPFLDHDRTAQEVTVVSETGQVWTADGAWIMCLWATARFRGLAVRLAEPRWRPRARSIALSVAGLTSRTPPPQDCRRDGPAS